MWISNWIEVDDILLILANFPDWFSLRQRCFRDSCLIQSFDLANIKCSFVLFTSTPSSSAMKPKMEKIANPAKTDVIQLPKHTMRVSLKKQTNKQAFKLLSMWVWWCAYSICITSSNSYKIEKLLCSNFWFY